VERIFQTPGKIAFVSRPTTLSRSLMRIEAIINKAPAVLITRGFPVVTAAAIF
jgi:hypothetical protein